MAKSIFENKDPKAGNLLLAEPFLNDPNFGRKVILLCEHNEEGSFGLVLNNKSPKKLNDFVDGLIFPFDLYFGGPVQQNTLHFIHKLGENIEGTIKIGDDLFWAGEFEQVKSLINQGKVSPDEIRFFLGYSGWGPGQLSSELKRNSWIVSNHDELGIFKNEIDSLWREILKNKGGKFKEISNYPIDPRLN